MKHSLFGCKVNKFYLNKRLNYFQARQFDVENGHLVATCVVTDRAKSKRVRQTKKMLKDGERVFLTGCGAFEKGEAMDYEKFYEIYPSLAKRSDQITLLGEDPDAQTDLGMIGEYELNRDDIIATPTKTNRFTKKYIVIQSGCDTYCTFCLTIYKRGSNRNRPLDEIIDEINEFVNQGGQEIVITGVNLATRGASNTRKPHESKFTQLLTAIIHRTRVPRIRISSLGPEFLDDQFFEIMNDKRFLPHFHISIQHFNDTVLKKMNRNYDSKTLDLILTGLRNLNRDDKEYISIGADLIVGFPGESQQAFEQMIQAIQDYRITKLHAFPFSPHQKGETVPAGAFVDQVPIEIKKERMQRILTVGDQVRDEFLANNTGMTRPVLLEEKKGDYRVGWTPNYIQASIEGEYVRGDVIPVLIK